jgi:hypothetical protein
LVSVHAGYLSYDARIPSRRISLSLSSIFSRNIVSFPEDVHTLRNPLWILPYSFSGTGADDSERSSVNRVRWFNTTLSLAAPSSNAVSHTLSHLFYSSILNSLFYLEIWYFGLGFLRGDFFAILLASEACPSDGKDN